MNVAVIGLGLIGGSLLRALAAHGHSVAGYDLARQTREQARRLADQPRPAGTQSADAVVVAGAAGVAVGGWRVAESVAEAAEGSDLVVLAVPLPAIPGVLTELAGYPGLITDVTSVKGPVRDLLAGHRFVGGHPMAGTESSGFAASDPHLFAGCAWVLCLEEDSTDLSDWLTLARLCTALGARVVAVTAAEHDRAVAEISHVPHLLAAALSAVLAGNALAGTLAAGSFRDGTRVAGTRPELIAAMCGGNAAAVRQALAGIMTDLRDYERHLAADDPIAALTEGLRLPSDLRRAWPPDAGTVLEVPAEPSVLLALGRAGGWITAVRDDTVEVMRPESDRNRS